MGSKPSSSRCEINIPQDGSGIRVEYIKSFTSSELTVGNREVTTLESDKGTRVLEQGNLKNIVTFKFDKMKDLCDMMTKCHFASIETKKGKFVTSGSDKGNSIIICQGDKRVEIRHGERGGLTKKEQEVFLVVEKSLNDLADKCVSSFTTITVKIDHSVYAKYDAKFPISFSSDNVNILILNGKIEGEIVNVKIQNKTNVIQVAPYSVLGDEPEDKNDIVKSDSIDLENGAIYVCKLEEGKLVVNKL